MPDPIARLIIATEKLQAQKMRGMSASDLVDAETEADDAETAVRDLFSLLPPKFAPMTPPPWKWSEKVPLPGVKPSPGDPAPFARPLMGDVDRAGGYAVVRHQAPWDVLPADRAVIEAAPEMLGALVDLVVVADAVLIARRSASFACLSEKTEAARALLERIKKGPKS